MRPAFSGIFGVLLLGASAVPPAPASATKAPACAVEFGILGIAQDAGIPQIGHDDDPAWRAPAQRQLVASGALVDRRSGARYLFDATPDIGEQLYKLDRLAPPAKTGLGLSGVFLTHAHIGHYTGLMYLGREAAAAKETPVYAMPRMADFLKRNGPWSQLVTLHNIDLRPLADRMAQPIAGGLSITPYRVPHRDEYSETVGFVIATPQKSLLFLPDIDTWQEWESGFGIRIEDMIAKVDYALIDGTFFDQGELPPATAAKVPHPRIAESIARFARLPLAERRKIRFIHFNHSNPVRDRRSPQARSVLAGGFHFSRAGDRLCLF